MTAIETERGVGQCPDRPIGFGHVWAGAHASGDASNPCRFCGTSGRVFFQQATAAQADRVGQMNYRRELTPAQKQRAAEVVADKRRRDAEMVAEGTARPGQVAGAPKAARS